MRSLPRSQIRQRRRSSLKGVIFTLMLAGIFVVSFFGALAWLDDRNRSEETSIRPASAFVREFLAPFFDDPEEVQEVELQHLAEIVEPLAQPLDDEPHNVRIAPPIDIIDARTFVAEGIIYRLSALEGPPRDGICLDEEDRLWACGLQARAAFNNLTRETGLDCEGVLFPEFEIARVTCLAGEEDLATLLVSEGFARPVSDGQEDHLIVAQHRAREDGRGLWNGNWRFRE